MYKKRTWKEILTIISGKSQKDIETINGKYPIYGSGGIIGYANEYVCPANSVIVGRKGTINRPIYVTEPFWNIDTAFGVVAGVDLVPKFLYFFCLAYNFKRLDKSTGRPSVSKSDLLKIEMPVPSIDEQQHIVSRIEELFSKLDKGVESLQTIKQQLAVYRQAVLKEAFEENERWTICSLGEVINILTDYHSNGSYESLKANVRLLDEPDYAIMIRSTNFEKQDFSKDLKYIDKHSYEFLKKSKLFGGEVLMGKIGNAGRVYYMKDLGVPMSLAMNMFAIRFVSTIDSKFAYYYLLSPDAKQDIRKYIKGVGTLTIDKKSVRRLKFRYPSIVEQKKIVEEIESRLSVCDSIEQTVDTALAQAEAMRQSILKKAFEGGFSE